MKKRFFWIATIFIVAIFAAGGVLLFGSFFQITDIRISGNVKLSADDLKASITPLLHRNLLFLSSQSIALVNTANMRRVLLESFPQISRVAIGRKFPNILTVVIQERVPALTWCQDKDCFAVDQQGIAFEKIAEAGTVVRSETQQAVLREGSAIFAPSTMDALVDIQKTFNDNLQIPLQEISVSSDESKFTVNVVEGWQVYLADRGNVSDQLFNLIAVLKEKIPQQKRGNLEYIDLRFGNKVYYKYRSVAPPQK